MKDGYRKERLDRGVRVRSNDIFLISSYKEVFYTLGPWIISILGLFALPLFKNIIGIYWMNVLFLSCIIALITISWVFLASLGLPSLGQAFFFGVGCYISGFFGDTFEWGPLLTIPIATVGGAGICTAILFPVLRLRGVYFGLITFALPLLLMRLIDASKILGGGEGLTGLPPFPHISIELYLVIAAMFIFIFGYRWLFETDYGFVLKGLRDNDRAVLAAGIGIRWYKTQGVFIASLPSTFAGAVLTHHYQFVGLPAFAMDYSLLPLASAIVGGPGTFTGAAVGAFILVPISELLRGFGTLRMVIYSIILVVVTVGLPEGIFHYIERKYSQFERIVTIDAAKEEL